MAGSGCLAIALQVAGTTRCRIADHPVLLRPGMVALLDPGRDADGISSSPGCQVSGLECDWRLRPLREADPAQPMGAWLPGPGAPPQDGWTACLGRDLGPVLAPDLAQRVAPFITLCARTWWLGPGARLAAAAQFLRLALLLLDDAPAGTPSDDPCTRAEQAARQQIRRGFTVSGMAAAAGMSRSHFSRRYATERGHGPGRFLRQLRLEVIAHHLAAGQPPAVLARNLGFASPRHLAQFVRRASGQSWGAWLAAHGSTPEWPA